MLRRLDQRHKSTHCLSVERRQKRGTARVPRWASVRTSCSLGRYSSEIRTGCANERPSGSVRGGTGQLVSLPRSTAIAQQFTTKWELWAPDVLPATFIRWNGLHVTREDGVNRPPARHVYRPFTLDLLRCHCDVMEGRTNRLKRLDLRRSVDHPSKCSSTLLDRRWCCRLLHWPCCPTD